MIHCLSNQTQPEALIMPLVYSNRTEELLSIGFMRVSEIAEALFIHRDTVRYRIAKLGIVPFEKHWYNEHQIELIKFYETYKLL